MVDINLFEDDEEEIGGNRKERQPSEDTSWDAFDDTDAEETPAVGKEESLDTDSLDDAFGFDDDFDDDAVLNDDALSDESDTMPDFEEGEDSGGDKEYQFGEMKKKGGLNSVWILAGLLVVLVAALYLSNLLPFDFGKPKTTTTQRADPPPRSGKQAEPAQQTRIDSAALAQKDSGATGLTAKSPIAGAHMPQSLNKRVAETTNRIANTLTKTGRLGVLIVERDRFRVEYVSDQALSAQSAGDQLKALFRLDEVKTSPEERITSNGNTFYSSVLSGVFPEAAVSANVAGTPYADTQAVQVAVTQIAASNQLKSIAFKMKSAQSRDALNGAVFEAIFEGGQSTALSALHAFGALNAPLRIDKVLIYPEQSKLVLDFWAALQ